MLRSAVLMSSNAWAIFSLVYTYVVWRHNRGEGLEIASLTSERNRTLGLNGFRGESVWCERVGETWLGINAAYNSSTTTAVK